MVRPRTAIAHRWCQRLHEDEEGVSLIEILIASFILVVAVLGIASTAGASLKGVRVSRDRDAAATAASAGLEAARDRGFTGLALGSTNSFAGDPEVVSGRFSHDGTSFEDLVLSNAGVTPYRCTATTATCWFPFHEYGKLDSAALYVTRFDDPTVDGNRDGNLTNDVDGKRATVVITWTDAGQVRTVRQSTIIAESKRGLGLPEYQVSPLTAGGLVKPNDVVCMKHTVFNAGAQDSYDLTFEKPTDATIAPSHQSDRIVINTKPGASGNHAWTARAWFGPNAATHMQKWVDDRRDPTKTPVEVDGSRMLNSDSDPRLETQYILPRDSETELHICYTHGGAVASDLPTVLLRPVLRSQLGLVVGQEKTTTLDHTVRVGTSVAALFLAPTVAPTGSFQTTAPAAGPLQSYDGDAVPGLTVPKAANNGGTAGRYVWTKTHDLEGSLTFTRARLRLWTNWTDAIQFGTTPAKSRLSFNARLCIVPTTQDSCGTAGQVTSISYEHASAGWCNHGVSTECPNAIQWSFATAQSVASGEHLLIQITCTSGSSTAEGDCHFAYGTETFPGRLETA